MSEIADNATPCNRRNFICLGAEVILRRTKIRLEDKGIGIGFKKPLNSCTEGVEMLLCPAKFQPWPFEWEHTLYSYLQGIFLFSEFNLTVSLFKFGNLFYLFFIHRPAGKCVCGHGDLNRTGAAVSYLDVKIEPIL